VSINWKSFIIGAAVLFAVMWFLNRKKATA
jgi:hypothetical protein